MPINSPKLRINHFETFSKSPMKIISSSQWYYSPHFQNFHAKHFIRKRYRMDTVNKYHHTTFNIYNFAPREKSRTQIKLMSAMGYFEWIRKYCLLTFFFAHLGLMSCNLRANLRVFKFTKFNFLKMRNLTPDGILGRSGSLVLSLSTIDPFTSDSLELIPWHYYNCSSINLSRRLVFF